MRSCERPGGGAGPSTSRSSRSPRGDRGFVTAEAAVVLPSLVVMLAMLLWGAAAVTLHLRCGDAARAAARAAARGEPAATVTALARAAAPQGAEVTVTLRDGLYRVRVTARTPGPGPLSARLEGEAVAHAEPGPGLR